MIRYLKDARFGKSGIPYGRYCGECVYFLAGAGCRKRGMCIRFETSATFCDDFVDVDEVRG